MKLKELEKEVDDQGTTLCSVIIGGLIGAMFVLGLIYNLHQAHQEIDQLSLETSRLQLHQKGLIFDLKIAGYKIKTALRNNKVNNKDIGVLLDRIRSLEKALDLQYNHTTAPPHHVTKKEK